MSLLKISKNIVCCVLLSCFLSACDSPSTVVSLSSDSQPQDASLFTSSLSIWADMADKFQLAHERERPEVAAQIAWLQANQDFLYKVLQTSAPYMAYIYEETKKRGLPAELALLPIVESEFNPNARSKAGAIGLWQFMPGTAAELGLKRNAAYDGRKDVIASTEAALGYLRGLHHEFSKDWLLAMAAYNYGPGRLQTAIDRPKKQDKNTSFWHLKTLPKETQKYVPKVLALAAVIEQPERYGIKLPPLDKGLRLAKVKADSKEMLETIIKASGADTKTLRRLNPGYRHLSATAGAPNNFLIPINKKHPFLPDSSVLKSVMKESAWLVMAMATPGISEDGMAKTG